jgi:predicted CXXCH cytochrome family protein
MANRLKYGILQLSFLVLSFGVVSKTWALEINYPQDGTYVTKSNYLIVQGGEETLLDGMMIEINGIKSEIIDLRSEEYRSLYGDKLVVEPLFDPGENTIIVEGYLRGYKVTSVRASVYYLADETKGPPANYRKEVFHLPLREKYCAACHNMQPTEAQFQDPTAGNPCAGCHARMLSRAHVHGPAGVYSCSYCHDLESQPGKYQVRLDDAKLCRECHEDQSQGDAMPLLHGPFDAGMCLICHDPHASDQPRQLVAEVSQLCLNCHVMPSNKPHVTGSISSDENHPLAGPTNPRRPGEVFHCASCHNPHGGHNGKFLVGGIKSSMALCNACHKK